MNFTDALTFVWPMSFLLIALFILRRVGDDIQPVAKAVVGGVAKNAAQYSLMYAMAFIYASAAGIQALGEFAVVLQHTAPAERTLPLYLSGFCKVAQPSIVAIIAYVTKPPSFTQAKPDAPAITVIPVTIPPATPPATPSPSP